MPTQMTFDAFCAGQADCICNSITRLQPHTAADWDYSMDEGQNEGQPSNYPATSFIYFCGAGLSVAAGSRPLLHGPAKCSWQLHS